MILLFRFDMIVGFPLLLMIELSMIEFHDDHHDCVDPSKMLPLVTNDATHAKRPSLKEQLSTVIFDMMIVRLQKIDS